MLSRSAGVLFAAILFIAGTSASFSGCLNSGEMLAEDGAREIVAREGAGWLEKDANGKLFLHTKGSPYDIGFQHGKLMAEGVRKMAEGFVFTLIGGYTGMEGAMVSNMRDFLVLCCKANEQSIPEEYRTEMQGIADGAGVSYDDILLLNEGVDIFLSCLYPLETIACNQFAAFGNATKDGRLIHGRDLMCHAEGYGDWCYIGVVEPENGNAFIHIDIPGLVGTTTAMGATGITCATNIVSGRNCHPMLAGEGRWFLVRQVAQYASSMEEGIEIMRNAPRGCAWLYMITDANSRNACVIESGADLFAVRHSDEIITGEGTYPGISSYPSQIEDKPDLIAVTNHYINSTMAYTQRGTGLLYENIPDEADSVWRYETFMGILLENYSKIDTESAVGIIDFLHPPNYEYYGTNTTQQVWGHVEVMDPAATDLWVLYGHYNDSWIHCNLKEELERD